MPRALPLLLLLLPALATAAKVRERWGFAWDAHPQAAQVGYLKLIRENISGGTATEIRDVLVPINIPGNGIAVLRACRQNGECSANSNAVTLDRTPPQPPTAVSHDFNQR